MDKTFFSTLPVQTPPAVITDREAAIIHYMSRYLYNSALFEECDPSEIAILNSLADRGLVTRASDGYFLTAKSLSAYDAWAQRSN